MDSEKRWTLEVVPPDSGCEDDDVIQVTIDWRISTAICLDVLPDDTYEEGEGTNADGVPRLLKLMDDDNATSNGLRDDLKDELKARHGGQGDNAGRVQIPTEEADPNMQPRNNNDQVLPHRTHEFLPITKASTRHEIVCEEFEDEVSQQSTKGSTEDPRASSSLAGSPPQQRKQTKTPTLSTRLAASSKPKATQQNEKPMKQSSGFSNCKNKDIKRPAWIGNFSGANAPKSVLAKPTLPPSRREHQERGNTEPRKSTGFPDVHAMRGSLVSCNEMKENRRSTDAVACSAGGPSKYPLATTGAETVGLESCKSPMVLQYVNYQYRPVVIQSPRPPSM